MVNAVRVYNPRSRGLTGERGPYRKRELTRAWLLDRCSPETMTGCWLWELGCTTAGYASVYFYEANGRPSTYGHRLAYELWKGPIPEGLELDHRCRTKCCVNPDHLEAVTREVNLARWRQAVGLVGLTAREYYRRRLDHGLCPKCGRELARQPNGTPMSGCARCVERNRLRARGRPRA